jgi:hypothetical protein
MKTTMKNLAAGAFIAFLLIVGNVKAEGTETKATSQAIETTLQLEKWMINEAIWNTRPSVNYGIIQETETGLQLENWMTNASVWNSNNNFVKVDETELELENWMTNDKIWSNYNNVEETETALSIENWMTNETIWNR